MTDSTVKSDNVINRVGGKIIYRFIGTLVALAMCATLYVAWGSFQHSGYIWAIVMLAISGALFVLMRWCFSSDRRLSDLDVE